MTAGGVARITAPAGWVGLGKLIEILMDCLNEPGVDDRTPVRVVPEFGRAEELLFVSGAGVSYPAGSGWHDYSPHIAVEWRRGEQVSELALAARPPGGQLDEIAFRMGLRREDPVLFNALLREGYASLKALSELEERSSQRGWWCLQDIPNIGPARLLCLVNFLREHGAELPWFADFDRISANWTALQGRRRASPAS